MGFDFRGFGSDGLEESFVEWLVDGQWSDRAGRFGRFWEYYQNPIYDSVETAGGADNETSRNYVQGQEIGLPSRITGVSYRGADSITGGRGIEDIGRKEVVIENDIAWRINAMVDFLSGRGVSFVSKAADSRKRGEIEQIINGVFAANGGAGFIQDMAVLGSVYGFVDCIVRPGEEVLHTMQRRHGAGSNSSDSTGSSLSSFRSVLQSASKVGLELIEAPRALPVLDENDYRKIDHYIQNFYQQQNSIVREGGFMQRLLGGISESSRRNQVMVTEVIGSGWWQRYENRELVSEGANVLGVVPVVHIQNIAQPYFYEGQSDVEQLSGLQDELNTRLSDRANRITLQSFKMYLAKGIEGFGDRAVSPGRMWCTDNPDASIEQFGGDARTPSEDMHIAEIREEMDKVSGVTPVVAGVLKNKLGNLTSGVALKMTFMGMLSKTARKQFTYGEGLKQIVRLILHTLDVCGVYHTEADERDVEVVFPYPLPVDMKEKLQEAQMKKEIGVPMEQLLSELGYRS